MSTQTDGGDVQSSFIFQLLLQDTQSNGLCYLVFSRKFQLQNLLWNTISL
jgi:hypothetical protein